MPRHRLPFPTIVVASQDDVYVSLEQARAYAEAWGGRLVDVGAAGHINSASNLGAWPAGYALLEELRRDAFVRQAIELAHRARAAGNHPFGALLVVDGKVALVAQNTVNTDHDPTAHAETNLVSQAIKQLSPADIGRSVLYTSCEPCAMCAGKIYWAGVRSIVYALSAAQLAALAGRDFLIPCAELFGRAEDRVSITGPLLLDEARQVHLGFWPVSRG